MKIVNFQFLGLKLIPTEKTYSLIMFFFWMKIRQNQFLIRFFFNDKSEDVKNFTFESKYK